MSSQPLWMYCYVLSLFIVLCIARPLFGLSLPIDMPHVCDEGAVKSHPEDCASYFQCLNGEILLQTCPAESYFDPTFDVCVIDVNGVCAAASGNCSTGEVKVIPGNSCGYLRCSNGSLVEEKCDIGDYFNATLKICEIDENGMCTPTPTKCVEGDVEEDPEDCSGYLRCLNGNLIEENCGYGSFFNSTLNICEIDENGICLSTSEKCSDGEFEENPNYSCGYLKCVNGSLEEFKCTHGSYYNSTLKTCLSDENGICAAPVNMCIESEVKLDPEDCAGYIQCINGELVKKLCSYGSYFHTLLKRCVVDDDGSCIPLTEHCEEGERETDPEDCASYLECIDGDFIAQKCAIGRYFDVTSNACILDENFVCISQDN